MIHFDLPKEKSSIIKVIGVGGGGSNAVNHMYSQQIDGVNFIICNTDAQSIAQSTVPNKVQLGPHLTQGLGAGANPEIGKQATEESLEELRSMLEVNTKMAFVTAGMGGGTGTGGAPIIAKICKEIGVLTVGIVTTPFAYEGKKRQLQAEEGIKNLKQYVDTLLVISNDKLRHQFGNLKMREAFAKADNVLATAAKCITDVISSTGQINVDFADVCTVMKNGGVAILGNAVANGENRAGKAIEDALNSPLLNDNDIRGARWILLNINSSAGEHEFTMDEVEVIQSYILSQAGDETDVILGLGYDETLGDNIGITLIATGFEHKDPFGNSLVKEKAKKDDKIILKLETGKKEEKKIEAQITVSAIAEDPLAPKLVDMFAEDKPVIDFTDDVRNIFAEENNFSENTVIDKKINELKHNNSIEDGNEKDTVDKYLYGMENVVLNSGNKFVTNDNIQSKNEPGQNSSVVPLSAASGGYLARPSNIYAESKAEVSTSMPSAEEPVSDAVAKEQDNVPDMQLVVRNDIPAADLPLAHQAQSPLTTNAEEPALQDEAAEQKRKAAERLHKLRNLSFNINGSDPNNEFETVPAYIRRNMELYNSPSTVENFYSKYEVKTDDDNNSHISTINTFLDGDKPD